MQNIVNDFNKMIEIVKKNKTEVLEMKSLATQIQNSEENSSTD
jgi:hypothetical protein